MTCVEFTLMGARQVDTLSRGEQASLIKHYRQCRSCFEWTNRLVRSIGPMPEEVIRLHDDKLRELAKDPEAMRVIEGG